MVELVVIGFLAGVVAGISPCILPVLPVVLAAGITTPGAAGSWWSPRARPFAVVAGLVLSFSVLVLAGSELLSLLGLPQSLLQAVGVVLLVAVGVGLLIPSVGVLLERPFARLRVRPPDGRAGGFVMGLGLGLLFVPCAGPVLAAITVAGATHRVGLMAVALTLAFAAGAAVPLMGVAIAGSQLQRVRSIRRQAVWVRRVSGVVLIAMALALGSSTFAGLQRAVPGYTSALQDVVEGSAQVRTLLQGLTTDRNPSLADCPSGTADLVNCGPAPKFAGITSWVNTNGRPLTMAGLRGKVVLVDFWTYSCINCQRTLPHVEAWYRAYAGDGLVVVGVHTPEFAFEHVVGNVRTEAAALGVRYPVAIDNDYGTWDAYDNEYWPADYLIDATGDVRHVGFGEGDYAQTESMIRRLLVTADHSVRLPPPTNVPDRTPTSQLRAFAIINWANGLLVIASGHRS